MAFEEIVGQDLATSKLKMAIDKNRLSHAYLFLGQDGTLKRKTALALAKIVLSWPQFTHNPDPAFTQASEDLFDSGNHPDCQIIVPEGKQIKIKQIRDLKDTLSHYARYSHYSVVIIENADLMGHEAANALLKMLEEPLGEILFILLATHQDKLLETICSRMQIIPFKPLSKTSLCHYLPKPINNYNQDKLNLALALSFGSLSLFLSYLEEDSTILSERDTLFSLIKSLPNLHEGRLVLFVEEMQKNVKEQYKAQKETLTLSERDWQRQFINRQIFFIESFIRDMMLLKNHFALPLYHHDFKANYLELSYQESHLKKFLDTLYASYDKLEANVDYFLVLLILLFQFKKTIQ